MLNHSRESIGDFLQAEGAVVVFGFPWSALLLEAESVVFAFDEMLTVDFFDNVRP
jgi:hypothetical protein